MKEGADAWRVYPDAGRATLLAWGAEICTGEGDCSHRRKVGVLADLLLSHEGSLAFARAVGSRSDLFRFIGHITASVPFDVLLEVFSKRLPWREGIVDWRRYVWGACRGAMREQGAQESERQGARDRAEGDEVMVGMMGAAAGRVFHA